MYTVYFTGVFVLLRVPGGERQEQATTDSASVVVIRDAISLIFKELLKDMRIQ